MSGVAFARVGLLGNPSDGYHGKAIGFPVRDFAARVEVERGPGLRIEACGRRLDFADAHAALVGPMPAAAGGLERLALAAARRWARERGHPPAARAGCTLRCETTIPREVGLGGSSATILATLRALASAWGATPSDFELARVALAVEVEDLGIAAGWMDRLVQSVARPLVMDLGPPVTERSYSVLSEALLPAMLIAWEPEGGRPSGLTHGGLRARWDGGDRDVLDAMQELRELVDRGLGALEARDLAALADLVDRNFALRLRITDVEARDVRMVEIARAHGAAAKLCGSGGAVLVVPRPGVDLGAVERGLRAEGLETVRPTVEPR